MVVASIIEDDISDIIDCYSLGKKCYERKRFRLEK